MKVVLNLIISLFFLVGQPLSARKQVQLISPDGKIKFSLVLGDKNPVYSVSYQKQVLIFNSPLSIVFDNGVFGENLKINKPLFSTREETYELVVGKSKRVHSLSKEVLIPFEETVSPFRKVNLVVRAFNDGLAFRYEFPKQPGWASYVMYDELTTFNVADNPRLLTMYLPSYQTSHEAKYSHVSYNEMKERNLMDMPVLFEFPNQIYMSITEAAVRDYAGMYLWKERGNLQGKLSPKLNQEKIKVEASLPHQSPWRVMMISNRVGTLIESDILTNLNEPCKLEDTSWIQPGKTTFTWWNGNITPDTTFLGGNNFSTNKYYIDFAADNGLDYHAVYGYAEQPWYMDDGTWFGNPGPNSDITKPVPGLDMQRICDYAKSRGVRIYMWTNWKPLYAKVDEAFALFEKWGVAGMMIDFMDRDDQEMIRIQEEFLSKAAEHHLFVQFHGSSKPSGLHRTYPNEFTREGTLNYENLKGDAHFVDADHDISIPFTRLLAGATDYHLGGFRVLPKDKFKVQQSNPYVTSTRCHMLAMYVVLESYLGMICDTPEAYKGQPGFEFLQAVPTVWDKTIVLDASVNEYVTVARKKDNEWFVGAINNGKTRTVDISFDFLEKGFYSVTIYSDDDSKVDINPNKLIKRKITITSGDKLSLNLASDGGAALLIEAKEEKKLLPYSYVEELNALHRIDRLPAYRTDCMLEQISSYDTTGGNDDGFSGKYSHLYKENGKLVIADLKGPGVINRIWTPTPTNDTLAFYFDGEKSARLKICFNDLFSGKVYPFVKPVCGNEVGGFYCYLPIPYSESCKVTFNGEKLMFQQIQYRSLPGYKVDSYTGSYTAEEKTALDQACKVWSVVTPDMKLYSEGLSADYQVKEETFTLLPGREVTFFDHNTPGRIVGFEIDGGNSFEGDRKDVLLYSAWDNESVPAIYAPLADFFGYAYGKGAMRNIMIGRSGTLNYNYIPCPYDKSARMKLIYKEQAGEKQSPVQITTKVYYNNTARDREQEGKFYSNWRREIYPENGKYYEFANLKGKGHYVGTVHLAQGMKPGMTGFFEGDDSTYVDGKMCMHGTGSEDYYNGGWYAVLNRWDNGVSLPIHGSLDYSLPMSRTGGYRFYTTDKVTFEKELYLGIEHGSVGNTYPVDYASVAYYYSDSPKEQAMEPTEKLRELSILTEHIYYPALMHLTFGHSTRLDYRRGLAISSPGEGNVRVMLDDVPEGHYKIYLSYYEKPNGADFRVWQRQNLLAEWQSSEAEKDKLKTKVLLGEINLTHQTNSITIQTRGKDKEFEFDCIYLDKQP